MIELWKWSFGCSRAILFCEYSVGRCNSLDTDFWDRDSVALWVNSQPTLANCHQGAKAMGKRALRCFALDLFLNGVFTKIRREEVRCESVSASITDFKFPTSHGQDHKEIGNFSQHLTPQQSGEQNTC